MHPILRTVVVSALASLLAIAGCSATDTGAGDPCSPPDGHRTCAGEKDNTVFSCGKDGKLVKEEDCGASGKVCALTTSSCVEKVEYCAKITPKPANCL